jgi:hypothetical protein
MPGYFDADDTQVFEPSGDEPVGACYADVSIDPAPDYDYFLDSPFMPDSVEYQSATEAYKRVLSDVGANVPALDEHDTRIIDETLSGTTTYTGSYTGKEGIIDNPDDAGGLEDWPEASRSEWDADSDGDGVADWWDGSTAGTAYTVLDTYLNWLADPHVFVVPGGSVEIDLTALSAGFVDPSFTAEAASGTVEVSGSTATYTAGEAGIDTVVVSITDSEGSEWSRDIGVGIIEGYE